MGTNRLGQVRKLFQRWVARHGSGAGHAIPEKLRLKAVELLMDHSIEEVARELGLGECTVSRWRRVRGVAKKKVNRKSLKLPEFIEVKRTVPDAFSSVILEWVRPDGNRLKLDGCREGGELRGLINEFLRSE